MSADKKVPDIRFKGFSGEWEKRAFGDCFDNIPNNTLSRAELNYEHGIARNIHYGDVLIKFGEILDANDISLPFITDKNFVYKQKHATLRNGDIVIADAAEDSTVGKCTELFNVDKQIILSGLHTIAIRPTVPFASKYLGYYLNSSSYHDQLLPLMQGTKVLSISKSALQYTNINFPSKNEEQIKIGNIFQRLDSLINQHQQKHDKLSNIKKSMLEKMFPKQGETVPEIRFKGFSEVWEQSNLARCTDLLTGNPFNSKEFTAEGIFLVRGMNVKRGYLDTSKEISAYWPSFKGLESYLLKPEDIVIQMDGALIGKSYAKIKSSNLPAILVQRVTRVRCSEVNSEFIYQYIQKNFLNYIWGIKTETAVPHLSLHDIKNFSIFLPTKKEQTAIGNYFQKLDTLIEQHQQQITKLNNIKQACLSKMFI